MSARRPRPAETPLDPAARAALLEALERGALSAEEALREALRGRSHLARWVRRRRPSWRRAPARRPTVRRTPPVRERLARAAVRAARRRHGAKEGVVSVHWGLAREEGRSTARPGVVVVVERKRPEDALAPAERIERRLDVTLDGRRRRVLVDVQGVPGPGALRGVWPGRNASARLGGTTGTVGALVLRDGEWRAVLSGHVAGATRRGARAWTPEGTVVDLGEVSRVVLDDEVDAAAAGPVAGEDAARLATREVEVRELGEADLGVALRLLVARDLVPRKAYVTDVGATVPFRYPRGVRRVRGLVGLSHDVTVDGDSGAPALDFAGRLVGFLIGSYDGRSYLVPARRTLDVLDA